MISQSGFRAVTNKGLGRENLLSHNFPLLLPSLLLYISYSHFTLRYPSPSNFLFPYFPFSSLPQITLSFSYFLSPAITSPPMLTRTTLIALRSLPSLGTLTFIHFPYFPCPVTPTFPTLISPHLPSSHSLNSPPLITTQFTYLPSSHVLS